MVKRDELEPTTTSANDVRMMMLRGERQMMCQRVGTTVRRSNKIRS